MRKIWIWKSIFPLLLLFFYLTLPAFQEFLRTSFGFLRNYDFAGLRLFLLSFGPAAPLVGIFIMALQAVVPFFPGVVMTLTNAWLFGWLLGSVYSAVGSLLGATLDFYLGRWYGQTVALYFAGKRRMERLNDFVERRGALSILFLRLIPVMPYKIVSYSAGISQMGFRAFIFATLIGQMPAILLYSFLGEDILKNANWLLAVTVLSCLALALFAGCRKMGVTQR